MSDYSAIVLSDTPKLYYRLGDSSGITAVDGSGNATNGTYSPNAAGSWTGGTLGASGGIAGDTNTSASFNGSTGVILPSVKINTATATVEAWVYLTANPSTSSLVVGFVDNPDNTTSDKQIYVTSGGLPGWYCFDGGVKIVTGGTALSLNKWHHLVGTADGVNSVLYVDGASAATTACGNTFTGYAGNNIKVGGGAGDNATGFFPGKIDEVAVYLTALGLARVRAHYLAGRGGLLLKRRRAAMRAA